MASTPKGATELGRNLYLFKSTSNSVDCIISAHGGYFADCFSFKVPKGLTIRFYGPHGASLLDPGIEDYMRAQGDVEPVEDFTEGKDCRNYRLHKYQGAHAGQSGTETLETYEQVHGSVKTRDAVRFQHFKAAVKHASIQQPNANQFKLSMDNIRKSQGGSVLTVRHRWGRQTIGVSLADAVDAARKEMPTLKIFHALFCRSYLMGDDPLKAVSVNKRKP